MNLPSKAAPRRSDEACLYDGQHGDERVLVFVSHAADHLNHLCVRVVFSPTDGSSDYERVMHLARSRRIAFTVTRFGKPTFKYPPRDRDDAGAVPLLFETRRTP